MSFEFFCTLTEMHDWEAVHHVAMKTVVGRALYFGIFDAYMKQRSIDQVALKTLVSADVSTERGVRIRIREFEKLGLIRVKHNPLNKRTKRVVPTEKLIELMFAHEKQYKLVLQKRFILVEKNETNRAGHGLLS